MWISDQSSRFLSRSLWKTWQRNVTCQKKNSLIHQRRRRSLKQKLFFLESSVSFRKHFWFFTMKCTMNFSILEQMHKNQNWKRKVGSKWEIFWRCQSVKKLTKKVSFELFKPIWRSEFKISRHFVFILIGQSSPHSTADFYQNSPQNTENSPLSRSQCCNIVIWDLFRNFQTLWNRGGPNLELSKTF